MKKMIFPLGVALIAAGSVWIMKQNPVPSQDKISKTEIHESHEPEQVDGKPSRRISNTAVSPENEPEAHQKLANHAQRPIEELEAKQQPIPSSSSAEPQTVDQTDALVNEAREDKIFELMTKQGSDLEKYVEVHSIVCKGKTCTIEATAKESPARFQMSMAAQLERNPWLGNKIKMQTPDNEPGVASITFLKE